MVGVKDGKRAFHFEKPTSVSTKITTQLGYTSNIVCEVNFAARFCKKRIDLLECERAQGRVRGKDGEGPLHPGKPTSLSTITTTKFGHAIDI